MDQFNIWYPLLCFYIHVVLCNCGFVISPISGDLAEEKACPSNFSIVWLGHTLSRCSTSVTNKSVKVFHKAKDTFPSYVSYEHIRASLFFNEAFFKWTLEKTTGKFFFQMILLTCFSDILAFVPAFSLYPAYIELNKEGKLLIAVSAPLVGVVLKVISRISVQRLWKFIHPGYSYVLLVPVYFGSAVLFRVLQAD